MYHAVKSMTRLIYPASEGLTVRVVCRDVEGSTNTIFGTVLQVEDHMT